ncbi:hypothetical protein ACINNAV18_3463 [Acinetobacter baumannii Naval-18]|nr:hypothetical protein ACINNAV18_3463 [Acinetobacter baumannii Naval-18]EXH98932.1 putative membrane protein [Acinetobacter baumannii 457946]
MEFSLFFNENHMFICFYKVFAFIFLCYMYVIYLNYFV